MNRNAESYFALTPSIDISRSRFDMSHSLHSSANIGQLIPIELTEVLPGDTFEYKTNIVARLQPLVAPLMDDIRIDIFWFFAPMRILWDHTKEFFGENTESPWAPTVEYQIPQIEFKPTPVIDEEDNYLYDALGPAPGTVGDYLGLPMLRKSEQQSSGYYDPYYDQDKAKYSVNALPFRMYASVVNEFFRSEALQNPINIPKDDTTIVGLDYNSDDSEKNDFTINLVKSGNPFNACKLFDYFTGALPTAQRSLEPVMALPDSYVYFGTARTKDEVLSEHSTTSNVMTNANANFNAFISNNASTFGAYANTQPNNWMIDGVSVEQLRVAFQVQKYYEATARSGGRYRSILESLFHVHASDQSMQVPEFLGSESFFLNVDQVLQTSETGSTPQGNPAGISVTSHTGYDFMQSFTEHGYVMGLMVARYHHNYQQGINRMWNRKDKFDFYWPQFANIGEQPILNQELYVNGYPEEGNIKGDNGVFGYQEAWADYRYKPSIVTGEMRSEVPNSLDMYHLADDYDSLPMLGDSWIQEDKSNLDRCLATTSKKANQYWFDMYFDVQATRPMPVHSIPGLIDHH